MDLSLFSATSCMEDQKNLNGDSYLRSRQMADWSKEKGDELTDLYEDRSCLYNTTIKE